MVLGTEKLRSRLSSTAAGETQSEAVVTALDGRIQEDEPLLYRLQGKGGLTHDDGDEQRTIQAEADGETVAIVTDRRLLLVIAGSESTVAELPHLDLKNVDANDGLLRSTLTVEGWNEGSYSLRIAGGDELGAAVSYLRDASTCWQQAVAAIEDAAEYTEQLGEALEAGKLRTARDAREGAMEKLDRAESKLSAFEYDAPGPLTEQIEQARTELAQTQIRGHFARAKTLMTEARGQTEDGAYTAAFQNYWDARDHLEMALSTAQKADISEPAAVQSKLDTIETRLDHLRVRPLALARQSVERAQGTDKLSVEVEAWQEAFDHYRDALTAGWGTDIEFSGDTKDIRFQTEIAVANLIDARERLAREFEHEADQTENADRAQKWYQEGLNHLKRAQQLASEFRSGEPSALDGEIDRIAGKRYGQG